MWKRDRRLILVRINTAVVAELAKSFGHRVVGRSPDRHTSDQSVWKRDGRLILVRINTAVVAKLAKSFGYAAIAEDRKGPLFRTTYRRTKRLTENRMSSRMSSRQCPTSLLR
jgi:hypothetical protein